MADFGLSRILSAESISTGTYGTVTHMPPELLTTGDAFPVAAHAFNDLGMVLLQDVLGFNTVCLQTCGLCAATVLSYSMLVRHYQRWQPRIALRGCPAPEQFGKRLLGHLQQISGLSSTL